jgi:hypothetical protein
LVEAKVTPAPEKFNGFFGKPLTFLSTPLLSTDDCALTSNHKHEAGSVFGLLCRVGLHRWRRQDLTTLVPDKDVAHCFWCAIVRIDGVVYDP